MSLLSDIQQELAQCERDRDQLRDYQSSLLIPFLLATPKSAAYVDMGLGKTVSVLTVLDELHWSGELRKALIIAPKRVAIQTWPTEIAAWRHTAWMRGYSLIRPDPAAEEVTSAMAKARKSDPLSPNHAASKARTAMFHQQMRRASQSDFPIHIINREQVVFLVEYWTGLRRWPYDTIIIDESTSFADHTSARWKALARVARHSKRIHLLSGTPAPENIGDLFAQIYLLDGGKRFGRGITAFRKRYMMQNPYTMQWTPQSGAVEQVTKLCADICLVMKEEDYLDTEKPLVIERPIVLDADELKRYRKFEETMILALEEGQEIEAVNAGVLAGKLLQYASGAIYGNLTFDESGGVKKDVHELHQHKIEELRELVEEMPDEPLLISYWFKPSLDKLRKAFPKAVVMDKDGKCVDDWNAGKIRMLLVHPQSAGHGLNMQKGPGHILVFYDTPASLELYLQIIKRLARPGQKKLVKVIHLVTKGTLDALTVPRLRNKESAQDTVILYLRDLRKKLLSRKAG